jgi:hypothetical protein
MLLPVSARNLIFACYGMNDGIYHPLNESRLKSFQDGIGQLRARAAEAGVRVIHVTPPMFDAVVIPTRTADSGPYSFSRPYIRYDDVLTAFSGWLTGQRAAGWEVVDLHRAMGRWVTNQRRADSNFVFAADGVHPNAAGHWFIAREILLHLGATDVGDLQASEALLGTDLRGEVIRRLIRERQQILRDAWLMEVGHTRPGVQEGLPVAEAQAKARELTTRIRELSE